MQGSEDKKKKTKEDKKMCKVEMYGYIINGSHVDNPCSANIGDKIEAEVDVTFDASEVGKWVKASVGVTLPNGTGYPYDSPPLYVASAGTQVFVVNLTPYFTVGGVYNIGSVYVYEPQTGRTLCSSFTPMWCHKLTLQAPLPGPCTIQAGFFIKNGSPISGASCEAYQDDKISAEVDATFPEGNIGQKYSAMMEIKRPDGLTVTIVSPYITVTATSTTKFIFSNWSTPIPIGTYTISKFWITDIYGNTICGPINTSGGYCQGLTIKASPVTLTTITISPASATIGIGGTQQPTAVCKDNTGKEMTCPPSLVWLSDNNNIAAVDGLTGLVTGVSAGTANITANVGTIVSNKAVITVSAAAPSLATITISPASATIGINGTVQLTAVCKDQTGKEMTCPSLAWGSDSIYVAVVTGLTGLVVGTSAGTANITAKVGTIVSNKAVITVSAEAPSLATITISPASATIGIGGKQNLTVVCKDQTGKVMVCPLLELSSDNSSVAVVDGFGTVIGQSIGTANITAQSGTIVSNKAVITVSAAAPQPAGIGAGTAIGLVAFAVVAVAVVAASR